MVIQASIFVPALLCLVMGARSRKMTFNTHLLTFTYWLVTSIEAADLLEYNFLHDSYKHAINTTEAIVTIVSIITHSYAVVTLCSYISPMRTEIDREFKKKFDFVYQSFVAVSGVLFTEIPLLSARVQILVVDTGQLLPGAFYMWLVKDVIFIFLLVAMLLCQRLGRRKSAKMLCTINLDTPNVVFQPEKRDAYIVKKKSVRFKEPLSTTFDPEDETCMKDKKFSKLANSLSTYIPNPKSVSHDSGLDSLAQEKSSKRKATRWKNSPMDTCENGCASKEHCAKMSSNPELRYEADNTTDVNHLTVHLNSDVNENCDTSMESLA